MLCEYGCGGEAKFPPKKGKKKWSCEEFSNQCPYIKKKILSKTKGRKRGIYSEEHRKKISIAIKNNITEEINTTELCEYGCGKIATFKFKNGKLCCGSHASKCNINKKRNSDRLLGHKLSKLTKNKISEKIKIVAKENKNYIIKQSESRKLTIEDIKIRYPLFCKVEWIEETEEAGKFKIQCKNHSCKNSKEKGGYFIASYSQIYERIRALESGRHGQYIYCSDECKHSCIMFGRSTEQLINFLNNNKDMCYTQEEYNTWRNEVLNRANYLCEYCGEQAEHCHHIKPQKLEPFFSLDPDFGIACCIKCHYEKGHKIGTECSTGNLANKI